MAFCRHLVEAIECLLSSQHSFTRGRDMAVPPLCAVCGQAFLPELASRRTPAPVRLTVSSHNVQMHTLCFIGFSVFLERESALRQLVDAWRRTVACIRLQGCSRRKMRVLALVRTWRLDGLRQWCVRRRAPPLRAEKRVVLAKKIIIIIIIIMLGKRKEIVGSSAGSESE